MAHISQSQDKKNLNVELNLMPVFDVLAVCICFLLMSVVWVQVGMIKTSQSMGGQSQAETKNKPSVWVTIDESANINFNFKDLEANSKLKDFKVSSANGDMNLQKANSLIQNLKDQGIENVLVIPARNTSYQSLISIMDSFKQVGLLNIGITPL